MAKSRMGRRNLPSSPGPGNLTVVGIGASAGGLDACRKLLAALPANNGMAFVLVQHLDPTHESMMVDLLAGSTSMTVQQATDEMLIAPDHLYVIPPGAYLAVGDGMLHLSPPQARHGARLPFDFLLHSLATACGARAIAVVLSGTGADGSLGLKSVKDQGGLIIAQDPVEAGYDGMPRNAMSTGAVDLVLPVAEIPAALVKYDRYFARPETPADAPPPGLTTDSVTRIVDLLRARTAYDFTGFRHGTLERRIQRRMAASAVETDDIDRYLDILRADAGERDLLARELLINVTSFFRDQPVFDLLTAKIVPELLGRHPPGQPVRIWVAGCSTGEETYSLAMVFREQIAAADLNIKLQIFASDVDADAVATAREGLYPATIEADVSPVRLARFFVKEGQGYRVIPELRAAVVFTVQDVLADPPFSRLDLVSCRNLLIYLLPDAQARVVALFHFALREGGILLLGNAETVGDIKGRFEVISEPERLYRHIGRSRPGEVGVLLNSGDALRVRGHAAQAPAPSRQATLAELCRRLVIEHYAPAAVLINRKRECIYSLGPTERYLRVAPGPATNDLLAMARQGVRTRLAAAIQQSAQENARVVIPGGRLNHDGHAVSFNIEVQPVQSTDEGELLVCFVDTPAPGRTGAAPVLPQERPRVVELERELQATRTELQGAIHNLETSIEEQQALNEEALSVNEEYQSANEELLTSKEELQSLNEELAALNSQLQETLERQRTTANDLQNVLYSTDVATLFLDAAFNIRFFTPATRSLFNVIPGDVGRPLADLHSLADDGTLLGDATQVLQTHAPHEREIEAHNGVWFLRRILPYRTQDNGVEGVVITFADITERKRTADALEAARRIAEQANAAKSRFLAAASHDLRQPLQTLVLLQGLLVKAVSGEKEQRLVARFDKTLTAMAAMLNALLDINQIETGAVQAEPADFPINALLERLREEFTPHAQASALSLRVVACGLSIHSDPRLLEQMLRNLLTNALKYTRKGKVLLGCRRHAGGLRIEVWDTGIGIAETKLHAIFEEYYQIDNAAREQARGLGLGLAIVQRLGDLLGHRISVRSRPDKGSMFAIEVALPAGASLPPPEPDRRETDDLAIEGAIPIGAIPTGAIPTSAILLVEDDPEICDVLELFLKDAGYHVVAAPDGVAALELIARRGISPDLILADYNLPLHLNGLQLVTALREAAHQDIPVIILTGDISIETLHDIALHRCVALNKPVRLQELTAVIQRQLSRRPSAVHPRPPPPAEMTGGAGRPVIYVVDDDTELRLAVRGALEEDGLIVEDFASCEAFLQSYRQGPDSCLLIDAYLPGMNGLGLLRHLHDAGYRLPAIMITGNSDVAMAVQAMKAGASDFIEKPISHNELLASIRRALDQFRDQSILLARQEAAAQDVASLTPRQRDIMERVLAGHPSKNIAADLGISQRTVENHRAAIMKKTGSKSLPALARLAIAAASNGADRPAISRSSPVTAGSQAECG